MSWKSTTKLGPNRGGSWMAAADVAAQHEAAGAVFVVMTAEGEQGRFTSSSEADALFKRIGGRTPWKVPGLRIERAD